jgi:uracil-DNA glycosylase
LNFYFSFLFQERQHENMDELFVRLNDGIKRFKLPLLTDDREDIENTLYKNKVSPLLDISSFSSFEKKETQKEEAGENDKETKTKEAGENDKETKTKEAGENDKEIKKEEAGENDKEMKKEEGGEKKEEREETQKKERGDKEIKKEGEKKDVVSIEEYIEAILPLIKYMSPSICEIDKNSGMSSEEHVTFLETFAEHCEFVCEDLGDGTCIRRVICDEQMLESFTEPGLIYLIRLNLSDDSVNVTGRETLISYNKFITFLYHLYNELLYFSLRGRKLKIKKIIRDRTIKPDINNNWTIADICKTWAPKSWENVFADSLSDLNVISDLLENNNKITKKHFVPDKKDLFRAFELIELSHIRVVIIGQDPYIGRYPDGKPIAIGLSFATEKGRKVQPSLQNIYKEIKNSYPDFVIPSHGDLSCMCDQGVMFLNACLTTDDDKSASHSKNMVWMPFITRVLDAINECNNRCIYLLLGKEAQKIETYLSSKNITVKGVHPSPLSANKGFFNSGVFAQINDHLDINKVPKPKKGEDYHWSILKGPIIWRIPN